MKSPYPSIATTAAVLRTALTFIRLPSKLWAELSAPHPSLAEVLIHVVSIETHVVAMVMLMVSVAPWMPRVQIIFIKMMIIFIEVKSFIERIADQMRG